MQSFTDSLGRPWSISIDPVVRDKLLADMAGGDVPPLDLYEAINSKSLQRLESIPLLITVLFSILEDQAKEKGISPEQFARGMYGDALDSSLTALAKAIADFFPNRQRTLMHALLAKSEEAAVMTTQRAMRKLDELTVEKLVDEILKESSTASADASELPAPAA